MAKILCIGQIQQEQLDFVKEQIRKQTIQPEWAVFYIDPKPAKGIDNRRRRIAENHAKLVELVTQYNCDYIWQIEGDGVLPKDALQRLYTDALNINNYGFITGIEAGRHGVYCLGAWHIDKDRKGFRSLDYKAEGLQEIDACGWYCLFAKKDVWLQGKASWNGERWGPDVNWGLSIPAPKYADMSIKIGHKTKTGVIEPDCMAMCNVEYIYNSSQKRWHFKQK